MQNAAAVTILPPWSGSRGHLGWGARTMCPCRSYGGMQQAVARRLVAPLSSDGVGRRRWDSSLDPCECSDAALGGDPTRSPAARIRRVLQSWLGGTWAVGSEGTGSQTGATVGRNRPF